MTMQFGDLSNGAISDEQVIALRRQVWPDGVVDVNEVEAVFALNEQVTQPSKAWTEFFVEAVIEFLNHGSETRGYLSDMQANWLLERLDRGAGLDTPAKLELLVHLLEKMDGVPARIKDYAMAHVERGVINDGVIAAEECKLLRRMIFAPSSYGPARVSAEEAEMLFRIKDATLGAANAPEWQTLFVQGVGNYIQGWQGLEMPTAEQEQRHEAFLAARNPGVGGLLSQMARVNPNGFVSAARQGLFVRRAPERNYDAEEAADHAVTPLEQQWLDAHIQADGTIDPLEAALIAFLQEKD